jgi:hypothetical protein
MSNEVKTPNFHYGNRPGFQMRFENGWTVSVQWHENAYRTKTGYTDDSPNAEIAAWDINREWFQFEGDSVKGYCTPDEVADFIHKVKSFDKQ